MNNIDYNYRPAKAAKQSTAFIALNNSPYFAPSFSYRQFINPKIFQIRIIIMFNTLLIN